VSSPTSTSTKKGSENNKKIRARVIITGKVQGVYFRQNTRIVANRHKVTGWVQNLRDGRVEAVLEGNEMNVSEVIEWFYAGPPKAIVNDVQIKYEDYMDEFQGFKVNY
jgi:acylphosphatase